MSAPETSAPLEELGIAAIAIAIAIGAACTGIAIGGEDGIGAAGANIGGEDGIGAAGTNIGVAIGGGGAIDDGMGNGIEAGSGRGDEEVRSVRGATDGGAGGAIEGARGAIGALLARGAIEAWLARGAIDAGLAVDTGASGAGGSVMRRVPGATLTGAGLSLTALMGAAAASRPFVSSASASAMSGGSPCAVAASS